MIYKAETLGKFKNVVERGNGQYSCQCPAHDDTVNSLSITITDENQMILHCFAGCDYKDIISAAGISPEVKTKKSEIPQKKIVAIYTYLDLDETPSYQVVRYEPKSFSQRRPDGHGNWIYNMMGVHKILYNLSKVLKAIECGECVFVVEGEKDADNLQKLGLVATTSVGGAGNWKSEYADILSSAIVYIIPDNDQSGYRYAQDVARSLVGRAESIKVIKWRDLYLEASEKFDISDLIDLIGAEEAKSRLLKVMEATKEYVITVKPGINSEAGNDDSDEKKSQADKIVELTNDFILFHDQNNEPFAKFEVDSHMEIWSIKSYKFKNFISKIYFDKYNKATSQEAVKAALAIIEARAWFEGERHQLFNRVAFHEGAIWYDLCNSKYQAVKITKDGWHVVDDPPILFRRYSHQMEQAIPVHGGDLRKVLDIVNIPGNPLLFLACMISCFIPDFPHPILIIHGEKGAAKTTTIKMLKRIIDPSAMDTATFPKDQQELIQMLAHHWFLPFDNISKMSEWISDSLCRACTGEGMSKRALYTDDDDMIYSFKRCMALNGINVVANREDLLDRSVLVELSRITPDKRREEAVIWNEFQKSLPDIMGGIFDTLVKALNIYPTVNLKRLPRLADFCRWGYAISEALDETGDSFIDLYMENIKRQNTEAIDANPLALALVTFMIDKQVWKGRTKDLLKELEDVAFFERIDSNSPLFPKAENVLTRWMNRIRSNLLDAGISFTRYNNGKARFICLEKIGQDEFKQHEVTQEQLTIKFPE